MKNLGLIKKIALSVNTPPKPGVDFDDLIQEGCIAYLEALRTFNPERGKITTYVWYCVRSHLRLYIKQELEYSHPLQKIETVKTKTSNFLNALNIDTEEIINFAIDKFQNINKVKPPEHFIYHCF